jgi:hypothetical protein
MQTFVQRELPFISERTTMSEDTPNNGRRMTMEDMVKVTTWVAAHKDQLPMHTLAQLCRMIKSDINVHCQPPRMAEFERAAGYNRPKGGPAGGQKDRVKIVAVLLRDLMIKLGADVSDDLNDICRGR